MSIFNCIPAMMYHHVNAQEENSTNITPKHFEEQIKYLADAGYRSLDLDEFYGLLEHWNIPDKLVLITFDDGYADNYIHAYPILKKYKMKATIFPVTKFIKDKAPKDRKLPLNSEILMESIYAKGGLDGYLTWEEMREMEDSGLIDIQSHCHTHAAYFEGDRVIDFYRGQFNPKFGWSTNGDMRLGLPVYKMGPALCIRKYTDDKGLRDKLATYVEKNGGGDFFMRHNANDILFDIVKKHGTLNGKFETESESDKRIMEELHLTKELIEKNLQKEVKYFCWPWGSVDKPLMERAKRAGFVGGIGTRGGANMKLADRMNIHRFNPCQKSLAGLKQKLYKHTHLMYSLYNDKKLDALFLSIEKFT